MTRGATIPWRGAQGGHPAPAQHAVPLWALWFGLLAGPVAWSVQTLVDLPVAAHGCFPRLRPLADPALPGLRTIAVVVSVAAVAMSIAALLVAWRSWSRTRGEHQEGSGRAREHEEGTAALETGEGRTRFMALAGLLTSTTFVLVTLVHGVTVLIVPPCAG